MVSSKGKPTDPKLREQVKEGTPPANHDVKLGGLIITAEVKNDEKGGGKGGWSAWKVRLFPNLDSYCPQRVGRTQLTARPGCANGQRV